MFDLGHQRAGQGDYAIIPTFGPADRHAEFFQTQIFDPQIQRLADTQAATIEQLRHEPRWVTGDIADGSEQGMSRGQGRRVTQVSGAGNAQSIHVLKGLLQDLTVKEQDGVESLVLGAGSDVAARRQSGEETFKLCFAGPG